MIPRASRVRRLVLFVCVLGGSLLGALFFALTASAQTSTPTPTVTPIWAETPTPTVTPVFESPDPGWGDVVWWYVMDEGAAVVGTWSSLVDVTRRVYCSGSGCTVYDPAGGGYTYVALVPPEQSNVVTYTCGIAGIIVGDSHTGGYYSMLLDASSAVDSATIDYTKVSGDELDCYLSKGGDTVCNLNATYRAEVKPGYSTFPAAGDVPSYELMTGSTAGRPIHLRLKVFAGTSHAKAQAGASGRLWCRVDEVGRFDGSTFVPRVPVVGDSGHDWVPWDDWDPIEWQDAPPTTGGFGFGDEVQGDCFTIVPGYQYTVPVPSWIGDDVPMGWPSREVCVIERDLDVVLFGMDLGQMAYVWVMLSAVFWMISVWRRG